MWKNLLLAQALRQTDSPLCEIGNILLHIDRIPPRVDAIHVEQTALGLFEGCDTHTTGKIGLIRGVDRSLGGHLYREGFGGGEGGLDGLGIEGRALGGNGYKTVTDLGDGVYAVAIKSNEGVLITAR